MNNISDYSNHNTLIPSSSKIVVKDAIRDSTIWDQIKPRSTDIIVASCHKSGTTLAQQIVNLIVNGHDNFDSIHYISPWVELRFRPSETETGLIENLPSPRILKTHLEFEALPYYQDWKYIYLARDCRDVGVSLYHHFQSFRDEVKERYLPPETDLNDFSKFWDIWIETGKPRWPFWEHINSWWQVRHLPNVLLVHYNDLTHNKREEVIKIANFLKQEIDSNKLEMICQYSSLQYMKENWQKFQPPGVLKPNSFINKGTNKRWRDLLTPEQLQRYEAILSQKLEPECANWLKNSNS